MPAKAKSKRKTKAKPAELQVVPQQIDVQNVYESSFWPAQSRSWLYEGVQDAQRDITPSVRVELLRQARYWEKNDPIVKRLISIFSQYTFGPAGLVMVPSTSDSDFNEAAAAWWAGWSRYPLMSAPHPLAVMQATMARRWFVDGEIFALKTYSSDTNRPRLQLIESQRVASPYERNPKNKNRIFDGVELDDDGRPEAYYVTSSQFSGIGSYMGGPWQDSYTTSMLVPGSYGGRPNPNLHYDRIEAGDMVHLYEPERADQYRGISLLTPSMRTLHDLYDLRKLEASASKDAAEKSTFITNATGQANATALRASRLLIPSTNAQGQGVTNQQVINFQSTLGGAERYLKIGEDVKQFVSNRPSVATADYWQFLIKSICLGVGISPLLVFPWSLQGTVTRAELDVMAGFFRTKSTVAGAVMRDLYQWAMFWAVRFDRSLDGAPQDWGQVTVRPPRAVNVDIGRNSQAVIAEYEAGFRALADICAEMGHDWRQVIRQKAVEAQFIAAMAIEHGVPPERIAMLTKQAVAPPAQSQPAKAQHAEEGLAAEEDLAAASADLTGVAT